MFAAAVSALLLSACTGCGTALRISQRPVASTAQPISVPGVPFYTKRARCRQEVVWFEPIYTLTLAELVPDKDGTPQPQARGAAILSRKSFDSQPVTDFMTLLNDGSANEQRIQTEWKKVAALNDTHVLSRDFASLSADDRILVGRSAAPALYVDYANEYYVNAKLPLAGTANVDAKVADDGTLSEASAQVETKTFETILGALPISSLITAGLGLPVKAAVPVQKPATFQLTIAVTGYSHTLARLVSYPAAPAFCPVAADISIGEATEYKREDITAAADASSADKSGDQSKKPAKPPKKP
jgi:hypothetical protein